MQELIKRRPTIGVLPGWEVYENATLVNYLGPLLYGIRAAARDRGCNLLMACGMSQPGGEIGEIRPAWPVPGEDTRYIPIGSWNTDGLIVINPLISEKRITYVNHLAENGSRLVFIGSALGSPSIGIDNQGGIYQAVAHLVEHGHKHIAFIAGRQEDTYGDSGERLQAYTSAMRKFGLEIDQALIAYGLHIVEGGRRAMEEILQTGRAFTAVIGSSDECAIGAMTLLKERGYHIPDDVAVIGFDDGPEAVVQDPPLTSVHSPTYERGYRAIELLLEYIERKRRKGVIENISTRLVVRQSCGCRIGSRVRIGEGITAGREKNGHRGKDPGSLLLDEMRDAVLSRSSYLSPEKGNEICQSLIDAFRSALEANDSQKFEGQLEKILQQIDLVGEDAHALLAGISVLRRGLLVFMQGENISLHAQAEELLFEAHVRISNSMQLEHQRFWESQKWMTDHMSYLTSRLLAALDEDQIYRVLAEQLPELGIQHAGVVLYEKEEQDPYVWSVIRTVPNWQASPRRFPSRDFPMAGFYPPSEPYNLALLPLVIDDQTAGYVAFDSGNLELNGAIGQQLASALRRMRLYREVTHGRLMAEEGRRMAEEASRMKSRFLSMVSHELRTPLNLIVGSSEMLLKAQTDKAVTSPEQLMLSLERIHANAQHLDGLIRDVLDLSQSEIGKLKLMYELLDLHEVIGAVALVGEQLASEKGLEWRVNLPRDLPSVWGDQARLRQVILNLVTNAVKFTDQGRVSVQVETGGGEVRISVRDTGLGIAPGEQALIFDEFRQSDRTSARGYGGMGLGLAICKRLIDAHGGRISVSSTGRKGEGSTFYFSLPAVEPGSVQEPMEAQVTLSKQNILLMVERTSGEERLSEHLLQMGFEVDVLPIGENTEWMSHLLSAPPGVVVLDQKLAVRQGWEVLKRLKDTPATRNVPVLFYSLEHDQDKGSLLELDYLTKPMGSFDLAQALDRQGFLPDSPGRERAILLVDDEPDILEMHAQVLRAQSPRYKILKARNGREALEFIRREHPDLVLLDLMMPELDGFGVLEAMRQDESTRRIPVVVLTAQVLTEETMAQLNQGVATVLKKGMFSAQETLAHIEDVLARKKRLGGEMQRLVRKAMAYIHDHYADPITRDELADHVGVSNDYLTRCFRKEMGVTPVVYLTRYRISQARALLLGGEKNISEVAALVGFSDSSYFSQVFRREVGSSPSAYAARLQPSDQVRPAGRKHNDLSRNN